MNTALISQLEASQLQQGNIIKRTRTVNSLDEHTMTDNDRFDTYKVMSVNPTTHILELVMTGDSVKRFGSPWETGRMFIRSQDLVSNGEWWV